MKLNQTTYRRPGFFTSTAAILAAGVCLANAQVNSQDQLGKDTQNQENTRFTETESADSKTVKGRVVQLSDYLTQKHLGKKSQRSVGSEVPSQDSQSARSSERSVRSTGSDTEADTDAGRDSGSSSSVHTTMAADIHQPLALIAEDTGLAAKVTPGKQESIYLLLARQNDRQGMQALQSVYQQVSGKKGQDDPSSAQLSQPDSTDSASSSERDRSAYSPGSSHGTGQNWQITGKVVEIGGLQVIFVQSATADSNTSSGGTEQDPSSRDLENQ